jgi:hypothetical protein
MGWDGMECDGTVTERSVTGCDGVERSVTERKGQRAESWVKEIEYGFNLSGYR